MSRQDPTTGLVLIDTRIGPATFAGAESTYSQAGPRPGRAEPADAASRWRPQISGAQDAAVRVKTLRGSYPGVDADAARVAYRLASDSTEGAYRGWNEPNHVANWSAPTDAWGADATYSPGDTAAAVVESTGLVVIVSCQDGAPGATVWSYDPRTGTWSTLYTWAAPALQKPIGLVYDADRDALILYSGHGPANDPSQVAYRSTDGGSTWSVYSVGPWGDTIVADGKPIRICAPPGGSDWLAFHEDQQFASSDHGVTWDLVEGGSKGTVHLVDKIPLWTGSAFVVVGMGDGTGGYSAAPSTRILSSARAPYSDADQHAIDATVIDGFVATVDYDGRLYVYTHGDDAGRCFVSLNGGTTWTSYAWGVCHGDPVGAAPVWASAVAAGAQVHLVGAGAGSAVTDADGAVSILSLGGWDQVEAGAGDAATIRQRVAWGAYSGSATVEAAPTYIPWDRPDQMGWAVMSAGGTIELGGTHDRVGAEFTVPTGSARTYKHTAAISAPYGSGIAILRPYTIGTAATSGVRAIVVLASGAYKYIARIEVGSDRLRVRDDTTVRASWLVADGYNPASVLWVKWHVTKGTATVWARCALGDPWTLVADAVTLTNVGTGATDNITFEVDNSSGADEIVAWRFVAHAYGGDWRSGALAVAGSLDTPADGPLGLMFGRPVPPPARAYPLPDACSTAPAYLSATGGPTHFGELVDLPVDHRFALANAYAQEAPSPRVSWRTDDDSAVTLVWDQGAGLATWWGGGIALAVLSATPRLWVLEQDDGAGGWTTLGTLDLAIGEGLTWTRDGRVVAPATGTAEVDRYLHEDELKGTTVDLDGVAVLVERNSGGYWTDDLTKQRVRITLADPGSAGTSGTAGVLCARSGVLVCYPSQTNPPRRKLRVTVAATQAAAAGYYEAGVLAIGRVLGFGAEPGWDASAITQFSREVRRAADGTPSIRRTGPARRTYSHGWTEGVMLWELASLARDPDRVGVAGAGSIATAEDVASVLPRIVEGALESGQVPTILLRRLPVADGNTVTDPDDILYGVVASESIGVTGVVGESGEGAVRVDALSFEEIR